MQGIDQSFLSFFVSLVVWIAATFYCMKIKRMPLYHPIFIVLVYHLAGFVLRPLIIFINGNSTIWDRVGLSPGSYDVIVATVFVNVALVSIVAGYILEHRGPEKLIQLQVAHVKRPGLFLAAIVVFFVLGIYGGMIAYGLGGTETINSFEVSVDDSGGQRLMGVSGYQTALAELIPATFLVLFAIGKYRKLALALLVCYVGFRFWLGAQRLSFVIVLIALAVMAMARAKMRIPPLKAVVVALLVLYSFNLLGGDRFALRRLLAGETQVHEVLQPTSARGHLELLEDMQEFDVATLIFKIIPQETGYSWGTQYLRVLVWPIPRQLWPDKPVKTNIINLNDYGNFFGLTWTLYGNLYACIGMFGLTVLCFLLGRLLSMLYRKNSSPRSPLALVWLLTMIAYMPTLLRDGGNNIIYFWGLTMVSAYVLCKIGGVSWKLNRDANAIKAA